MRFEKNIDIAREILIGNLSQQSQSQRGSSYYIRGDQHLARLTQATVLD